MKTLCILAALAALSATPVHAQLDVVATTSNMGALARIVGGDDVRVRVLVPPDRDAHYLQARPSMMAALRRADLLVAVGAGLEAGWLPAAVRGAGNAALQTSRDGLFEGSAAVDLIEVTGDADRAGGDVHPFGNPHFYLDPVRFAAAARALAERMAALDPPHAARYHERAAAFAATVDTRVPAWRERLQGAPPVLAYHKDANYLFHRFDVEVVGYIEPLPGIPPTARHLAGLVDALRGRDGVIVHLPFQPDDGPAFLADALGWRVVRRASNVDVDGGGDAYLALIDAWVADVSAR